MHHALRHFFVLGALVAGAAGAELPKPSPELKVTLTTGQEFQLSSLRGKVVALEFIFTTCPHCQQLVQTTGKVLREFEPRGFRAVAVACNDGADLLAAEFVRQFDVSYPVGIGTVETMFGYLGAPPRPFRLPHLSFVDRKGLIQAQFTGQDSFFTNAEENMRKTVGQLLGPPAIERTAKPKSSATERR
jgi:thiol-disulfide isomerase/thioredoxin